MENNSSEEHEMPSGIITALNLCLSNESDLGKTSALTIEASSGVTDPRLGLPNPSSKCQTCGATDTKHCEGHFGVINFPSTVLHPYFLSEVAHILNKVCQGCKSIRHELWTKGDNLSKDQKPKGCKYCVGNPIIWYPPMKFKISSAELFRKTTIIVEVNDHFPRRKRPKGPLPADYWDFIPVDNHEDESCNRPNRRVLSHSQVNFLLRAVDLKLIKMFVSKPESLFLNSFPVTPNSHRVTEFTHAFSNGQRLIWDERTRAYKKLVDFRGTANELGSRVMDCLKISKLHSDQSSSKEYENPYKQKNESTPNMSGLRYMKDVVLGKRNDNCFRTVVVGDPSLMINEIGIPCHIAERLQVSENLNSWNSEKLISGCDLRLLEKGVIVVLRESKLVQIRRIEDLHMGDTVYRPLKDGDTVLVNRPPSIHPHSLIALLVKVLPITSVVSINPICCSPFRGDFDGDCLHGYIPQSIEARVELSELVGLDKQLINKQSGSNLLSLGQDSLAATSLIMEEGALLDRFQMQQLAMFSPNRLMSPAIFKSPLVNGPFWTGKQLFSLLLPQGLDYEFPQNDVCISNGELLSFSEGSSWLRDADGNLFQNLIKHDKSKVLGFLYAAQDVLCEWLSMRGLSVSLSDLYLSSDRNSRSNMMEEISFGLQEAEQTCNFKQLLVDSCQDILSGYDEGDQDVMTFDVDRMCYDKQRSAALSQASTNAFKQVFRDIQSLVYIYASKDNSLLAMFKAGSKGNLLKLVQHSMCVGLQHSLVPLSFRFPHQLSCSGWNRHKESLSSSKEADESSESSESSRSLRFIPYAVVKSSFLTGLNPLECFAHSVTNRDSSFSDNADLPGTLTRRLMFFMRDLCSAYDGTVRNAYGNQLVQFSYDTDKRTFNEGDDDINQRIGGHPVGSLAACAISEAAYSALDQPISPLETSPLLNLKHVLECGSRKSNTNQTMTLYLSKKFARQSHGFEYGALEVKKHLERLTLSEIVSTTMIIYTPQFSGQRFCSPWVCHFHLSKELVKKREINVRSVIDSLYTRFISVGTDLKANISNLQITSKECREDDKPGHDHSLCITVTLVERPGEEVLESDKVRALVMPFFLETVIKGYSEVKKVDILWNDGPKVPKSPGKLSKSQSGEVYLKVLMSKDVGTRKLWNTLVDHCLQIMDSIDWTRSHPDNIHHFCSAYGIDAGWKFFTKSLESAVSDTGKSVLPEHLVLVANCLSASGEFVGLTSKGLAQQRQLSSLPSPFSQACFTNPSSVFVKAAKSGIVDKLQGTLDALGWGKIPSIGTGGHFDIVYPWKELELSKPVNVYDLLLSPLTPQKANEESGVPISLIRKSDKYGAGFLNTYGGRVCRKPNKYGGLSKSYLRTVFTWDDMKKLSTTLKNILHKYPLEQPLNEADTKTLMMALYFHPNKDDKIGTGIHEIKVGSHETYETTRCFHLVRTDGTTEDFSYHKCVLGALEIIAPDKVTLYNAKRLSYRTD